MIVSRKPTQARHNGALDHDYPRPIAEPSCLLAMTSNCRALWCGSFVRPVHSGPRAGARKECSAWAYLMHSALPAGVSTDPLTAPSLALTGYKGYARPLRHRKRIEEAFGWAKTIGGAVQTVYRGIECARFRFIMTLAAGNLPRLPKLTRLEQKMTSQTDQTRHTEQMNKPKPQQS